MNYTNITLQIIEGIAYITINRPKVLNALNKESIAEIGRALEKCSTLDVVKCVVFSGEGGDAFVAGADIEELQDQNMLDMLNDNSFQDLFSYIDDFNKPTIAMVNGYALGGGCELAMACDIRIASEKSRFGLPELNLSVIPAAGGTQRLARLVGSGRALYMILTGKMINADEALTMGLVSEVVKEEDLHNTVEKVANKVISKGPLAVKLAKLSLNGGLDSNMNIGLLIENLSQAILFNTEDRQEGLDAFLNKRTPQFKGK